MKSLIVGDLHGNNYAFEKAIETFEKEKQDELIFIGDYEDSYYYTDVEIIHLLNQVITYKKENPTKVQLLLGNHSAQYYYLGNDWFRCSGFRMSYCHDIHKLYMDNKDLFKIAYKNGDYLFTHAGINNKWFDRYKDRLYNYAEENLNMKDDFDTILNNIKDTPDSWILGSIGRIRGGFGIGGPLWADKSEMGRYEAYRGYKQIVGHTPVNDIIETDWDVTFIDCLQRRTKFLTVNHEKK